MSGKPNLDQVRARNALTSLKERRELGGKEGGDALSGFPALVINNGLMATLAFSKRQGGGSVAICDAVAAHLASKEVGLLAAGAVTLDALLTNLVGTGSDQLRLITSETIAYLNYLRRFHKAEKSR